MNSVSSIKNLVIQITTNKTFVFLGLVFFVGLFLRLNNISEFIWQQAGYDESRDMLVAKHIVLYGESISKGPLAAGGLNWLQNSPIYYYIIL